MKILIASDFYKPVINGVVTSIDNLKSGLELLGHEVRILTLSSTTKSYYEDGVYYIGSADAERIYPDTRLPMRSVKNEVKEILEWKPDVIHTQNEFCTFYIVKRKLDRKHSIPIVHTYHTVYGDYTHYFFKSKRIGLMAVVLCTKLLGRRVDCIVAPTDKIYKIVNSYGVACQVHTIPSGIALEKFYKQDSKEDISEVRKSLNISDDALVLLSVSRLGKEKNLDELIRCMNRIKEKNIVLVIAGDGPEKKKLKRLAEKMDLSDKIKFTGMIAPKKIPLYYHMADLFVSASTSEAQGLTYIEALASGTPILCKKDDCLIGVLEEEKNGYIFGNEKEFVYKLNKYLACEDKQQMSENASKIVEKYSKESFVNSLLTLYETYVSKGEQKKNKKDK